MEFFLIQPRLWKKLSHAPQALIIQSAFALLFMHCWMCSTTVHPSMRSCKNLLKLATCSQELGDMQGPDKIGNKRPLFSSDYSINPCLSRHCEVNFLGPWKRNLRSVRHYSSRPQNLTEKRAVEKDLLLLLRRSRTMGIEERQSKLKWNKFRRKIGLG